MFLSGVFSVAQGQQGASPARSHPGVFTAGLWLEVIGSRAFPRWLRGKESASNAGDRGSIPGLGRSPGEGIGYPLQHSWASLVAQMVKNPSAMQETQVQFLGWKDPLEEGMATHSSILAWRLPRTEELGGL